MKINTVVVGDMVHQLRALVTLAKNLGFVPQFYMGSHNGLLL